MQKIPEETIEQIRSSVDVVDVVSEYVQLTKRGRNWMGLCPFHGEKSPSFSVSQEKQIFHCFGCGAGGNAITFLMEIEHVSFLDALHRLSKRVGVSFDWEEQREEKVTTRSKDEQMMIDAHNYAADYYHHLLMNTEEGEIAFEYLQKRGFSKALMEQYGIGWSLPHWDSLTSLLQQKGFDLSVMANSGLIIQKEGQEQFFDRFRGRIMFPIKNEQGIVVGFSGRILEASNDEAKYLNSPESKIFRKSELLYHLDVARPYIRKNQQIIIMEGFMDVLAAVRSNVHHAVATMGTALTAEHIRKIKTLAKQVTICYDGDNAGIQAAVKSSNLLVEERLKVEIVSLPDGQDPDDFVREKGTDAFQELVTTRGQSFLSFQMLAMRRNKNFQFENDVIQYVHEVTELLASKASPLEQELYLKQLASEVNLSMDSLIQQLKRVEQTVKKKEQRQINIPVEVEQLQSKQKVFAIHRAENLLLAHMLESVDLVHRLHEEIGIPLFIHDVYNSVFLQLIGFYDHYPSGDIHRFIETLQDKEYINIVLKAHNTEKDPEHVREEIDDSLLQLRKHKIDVEIERKMHGVKEAERQGDNRLSAQLAMELMALKRERMKL